jgi:uncharacterized protein (TIGR02231 family)
MSKTLFMKPSSLLTCFLLFVLKVTAQEPLRINNSEIKEVKIYQTGAMVTRTAKATVNSGNQEVVIDGLSPYINPQSITLKGIGDATILSVNFMSDYLKETRKSKEITDLEELQDSLASKIKYIQNRNYALNETMNLLMANKSVGGQNNGVLADELELVVEYFNKKMILLKDESLENQNKEKKIQDQLNKVNNQLAALRTKNNQPEGNIVVRVDAKQKTPVSFEFSYIIGSNVSWVPFYDLRSKNVNSPMEVVYKAKINQSTNEDWNNVKLKLSTGNPAEGGTKPELSPWYLYFYQLQQRYQLDGMRRDATLAPSMITSGEAVKMKAEDNGGQTFQWTPTVVNQNQLASEYEIMAPYSIPSNQTYYQVEIQKYTINSTYEYVSAPKLDIDAFLTARLTGWENLSLTPGEANVYFDGAYVGGTWINPNETNDTLVVSLGRDKRINLKREKLKELSSNKLFGGNKERAFVYELTIKNSKSESVTIVVEDQIPVTTDKEIDIKANELSGGDLEVSTGFVKWKLTLQPGETIKKKLGFTVKHPKEKQIVGL